MTVATRTFGAELGRALMSTVTLIAWAVCTDRNDQAFAAVMTRTDDANHNRGCLVAAWVCGGLVVSMHVLGGPFGRGSQVGLGMVVVV